MQNVGLLFTGALISLEFLIKKLQIFGYFFLNTTVYASKKQRNVLCSQQNSDIALNYPVVLLDL